jgi:hypothetical protein
MCFQYSSNASIITSSAYNPSIVEENDTSKNLYDYDFVSNASPSTSEPTSHRSPLGKTTYRGKHFQFYFSLIFKINKKEFTKH